MLKTSLRVLSTAAVAPMLILITVQGSGVADAQQIPAAMSHAAPGLKASIGEVQCGGRNDFFTTSGIAGVTFPHCFANSGDIDVNIPTEEVKMGNNTGTVKYVIDGGEYTTDQLGKGQSVPFHRQVTIKHIHID